MPYFRLYLVKLFVASAIRSCEAEPMRPSFRRWIKGLAWLILSIFTLAFLMTAYLVVTIATKGLCVTVERQTLSSVPGLEFVVEDKQCGLAGAVQIRTILVARSTGVLSWFGLGRSEIFKALGDPEVPPVVTAIDPHTVRISINWVGETIFAKDRWQDITILYDIDRVARPSENDPPRR